MKFILYKLIITFYVLKYKSNEKNNNKIHKTNKLKGLVTV